MLDAPHPPRLHRRGGVLAATLTTVGVALLSPAAATANPLEPQPRSEETYVERFIVAAQGDDGTVARFHLQLHNAGVGDTRSECQAMVIPPSLETWRQTERLGSDHWSYAAEPYPVLHVGNCYLRGGKALEVHAELDGVHLTLVLQAEAKAVRLRGNRVKMAERDGAFYEKVLLVPWAPARLFIRFPSGKERVVHGHGYADHSRWNVLPYDIAKRWLRVRALVANRALLVDARLPPDGEPPSGWVWRQQAGAPAAITDVVLETYETAAGLRWKARIDSSDGTYHVTVGDEVDRYAPIEEMGVLGFVLRSFVGNPTTHTLQAQIERLEGGGPWTGIVEVHNENE